VAGDGNCLFRAIADQMDGNPENHPKYRKRICEYIETNRFDFEPFIEDDEPFDEYLGRMKRTATWGGQMEIQACSLAYSINVTIHQLSKPRWDIVNFPASQVKTVHLSYHQGEHYSSVRKIGDETIKHGAPKEIKIFDSSKPVFRPQREDEKKVYVTHEEQTVVDVSGCQNREFVRQLLIENFGDINATIEFILMVGPDNVEFQHEFLQEKKLETDTKRKKSNLPTTLTTCTTTTSTTTTTSATTSEEPGLENKKNKNARVDTNSEKENQPSIHPKLLKFQEHNLSNKERQERARLEKIQLQPEKPFSLSTTPTEAVDVTDIAQDLGSMQI